MPVAASVGTGTNNRPSMPVAASVGTGTGPGRILPPRKSGKSILGRIFGPGGSNKLQSDASQTETGPKENISANIAIVKGRLTKIQNLQSKIAQKSQ
jgi:hypothetical protein